MTAAAAVLELQRISEVFAAAERVGTGCSVSYDAAGMLVGAWVDDDVPAGVLRRLQVVPLGA